MTTPEEIKSCCAAAYGQDAVALVLGESYHPGGLALTRRLAGALGLRKGHRVADVASGPGATACALAAEYDITVDGVDLGEATVERARATARKAGLQGKVLFHRGDAERLPLAAATFDAVICECAFCTFPDKATAAAEFARVLRPGGRVGITDVTVADAGLQTIRTEAHDDAIARMIETIEARLTVLRMTAADRLTQAGIDVDAVLHHTTLAKQAVTDGLIGYALIIAEKP